jgi:hypothetical protein
MRSPLVVIGRKAERDTNRIRPKLIELPTTVSGKLCRTGLTDRVYVLRKMKALNLAAELESGARRVRAYRGN